MKHSTKLIEQPWAVAYRQGFTGTASGNFFHFYRTKEEAQKYIEWMERKKRWHGPIEYRPGESHLVGNI